MSRAGLRVFLLLLLAALVQIACALNPQPIPPGEGDDDNSAEEGSTSGASSSSGDRNGASGGAPMTPSDGGFSDPDGDATVDGDAGDAAAPDADTKDGGLPDAGDAS